MHIPPAPGSTALSRVDDERRIPLAFEFARRFHAASPWARVPLDFETCVRGLMNLDSNGYLDVREGGMIGGVLTPCMFNAGVMLAVELFWWSEDARLGRDLREGFEDWARESNAFAAMFSALADERETAVRHIYRRAGFESVEIGLRKVL